MANTVQIELQVDAQGAVQGTRTFDTAVKSTTAGVQQLGNEMQATGAKTAAAATQLSSAANSVEAFNARAKTAMAGYNEQATRGIAIQKQLGAAFDAAMLQGKTFVEAQEAATAAVASYVPVANAAAKATRNMGESYGVARIGASAMTGSFGGMASGLARIGASSKLLGPILENAMPVAIGFAMVGILADMGEKVYNLYEKYLSLDAVAEQFNATLDKQREKDFMDVHSIEEARAGIEASNDSAQDLQETVDALGKSSLWSRISDLSGLRGVTDHLEAVNNEKLANAHRLEAIELEKKEAALQHQINDAQIEAAHAGDGRLRGQARINAERQNHLQKLQEEQRYTSQVSGDPNAGREMEQAGISGVDAQAAAQTYNLQREQTHDLMQMRNAATNAALRGSALYAAQESQAIEELKFKDMNSAAARDAVHEKFHNEEMRRLHDERDATQIIQARAATTGMTGIQKIQAEGDISVGEIRGDNNLSDEAKDARVAAARQQTLAEMASAERSFTQEIDSLADSTAGHQISGFARINAEQKKQLDDLQKKFDEVYGHMDRSAPGGEASYQQGVAGLSRGKSAIGAGSADQRAELSKRNSDETTAIEAEANEKSLSAEKQKTAAIQAEYDARLRKYQEELQQQEISQDDYNRRVAAAAQERDAEMVGAAKEAHDKMARQFSSFFDGMDHPLKELAKLGDKAAGNAAASLVQRVQGSGLSREKGAGSLFGGLFTGIKPHGSDAAAEMAGGAHAASATSSVFSVGTAQIHVGSAQISFGGGGAFGGNGGGGMVAGASSGSSAPSATETFSYDGASGATRSHTGGPSGGGIVSGARGRAGTPGTAGAAGASGSDTTVTDIYSGATGATGATGASGSSGGRSSSAGAGDIGVSLPAQTYTEMGSGFGGGMVGGAGSAGGAGAPARSAIGAVPAKGGGMATAAANAQSGIDLYKQTKSTFGKSASDAGASMETTTSNLNNYKIGGDGSTQKTGLGGFVDAHGAQLESGAQGALGVYSAVEGNGGVGGALKGGMAGMQLGMALGGPIGAAIGAGAGAIVGAIGIGGREKARVYDLKQVRPRITSDTDAYEQGGMDYLSAYSDMQSLMNEAKQTVSKMGPAANSYYQDTIKKEIETAEQKFTTMQKSGRSQYTATAASYAVGSDAIPETGMALAHKNERIIPSDQNQQITRALTYRAAMQSSASRGSAQSSRTMNMNVHAIDSKGVSDFLGKYKHHIRAAINDSYAENSEEAPLPSSDILNPTAGWDPDLGDSMNPSYGFTRKRTNTQLHKKAVGGTPWTRETQNTGHTFQLSWLGRTWPCVQRLKRYYEQYEDGFFTIVDWDGGARQYVGRFTSEVTPVETANNKWDVQNVTFEEMPEVAMQTYPSDWTHEAIAFYITNDFGDQKLATSGAWTETVYTAATGFAPPDYMALTAGTNYTVFQNPGTAADWATYEYRGYGFRLWLMQGPGWGKCDVYIDDVLASTVDCYAAADAGPVMLLAQDLPLDIHRVQVVCDGTQNADATGAAIGWYALQVMR